MMQIWEDYYHILQVHYNAEQEVIEGAYRRLCKKYHPDVNRNASSDEKIKQINKAYEVLKNPDLRKAYHNKWLERNKAFQGQPKQRSWQKGVDFVIDDTAQKTLSQYFRELSQKNYLKAYEMLLPYNKKHVKAQDFIEWQKTVSKIYAIGYFELRVFNIHNNVRLCNQLYSKVIEFEVNMSEKNLLTGKVYQYKFTKMIVFQNNKWCVYLEYDDLKALIHKFEYIYFSGHKSSMAQRFAEYRLSKDELTGLISKKGFLTELEKEKNRFLRYMNPFCIAIVTIKLDNSVMMSDESLKYTAYTINQCIRNTDTVSHLEAGIFGILYTETTYEKANIAVNNMSKALHENYKKYYNKDIKLQYGLYEHTGRDVIKTFNIACSLADIELSFDADDYRSMDYGNNAKEF